MIDLPEYLLLASVLFLFIASFLVLAFVIPLQIEQANVKNGLRILRKLLLVKGITFLITGSIAEYFLTRGAYRVLTLGIDVSLNNSILLFVFSLGYLILSFCAYKIYHIKYVVDKK